MCLGPIEDSNLHDREIEAVIEHAEKDQQNEEEQFFFAAQELQVLAPQQQQ